MSSSSAEYKKALKTLEGEKRAALKKAKTLKGAKGKEAIAQIEEEFTKKGEELLAQFQDQQQQEPSTETSQDDTGVGGVLADATTTTSGMPDIITKEESTTAATTEEDEEEQERQRKKGKNLRKKEKQRQKEKEKQQQEEEAHAQAMSGPNLKQMEWDQIQNHLNPLQLKVQQVVADGHCLYRAIGSHIGKTHIEIRSLCADTLASHPDEFAPFCEYNNYDDNNGNNDDDDNKDPYDQYVSKVRNSAEWGGHLELRALAIALNRSIFVYQANLAEPLEITAGSNGPSSSSSLSSPDDDDGDNDTPPIRLSYHRHYYALGEHYNQVVSSVVS